MIEIEQLTKRFGAFTAVDNLSLSIPRGKIFAFLGTNGAGKTTTIRMITGVLRPSSGTVRINGYDIIKDAIYAKASMGVIPDRPYLYGKLTGREFLRFIADLYRVPVRDQSSRLDELLEVYGLTHKQHELIDGYSHGMKQRLMMCASLVHRPPVLIVDEPMVGLDPPGARLLKDSFREQAANGTTIFMSTHSLSVAEEIADHLAIIKMGQVVATGTLSELYKKARNDTTGLENIFLQIIAEGDEDTAVANKLPV